jgi:hypothetical protein
MEIQIDTGILGNNIVQGKSAQSEEMIIEKMNEIDSFISNDKHLNSISSSSIINYSENYEIQIFQFLFENSEERSVIIYGKIFSSNQTFYDYEKGTHVFILTKNAFQINRLISQFLKFSNTNSTQEKDYNFIFKLEIQETLIIKSPLNLDSEEKNANKNSIYLLMFFLNSICKIFSSISSKYKYNKNEMILLNSKIPEEAFLMSNILALLEHKCVVNTSCLRRQIKADEYFVNIIDQTGKIKIDNYSTSEEQEEILSNNKQSSSLSRSFHYFLDSTYECLLGKNKLLTFTNTKEGGVIILLDYNSEKISSLQFDPYDLEMINSKNLSLSFTNIENALKFTEGIGKYLNFIHIIFSLLIEKVQKNVGSFVKILLKKIDCKIFEIENIKEITMEDLTNRENYINMFIIGNLS